MNSTVTSAVTIAPRGSAAGALVCVMGYVLVSSRRRHTRCSRDWSSDVCSSDLGKHARGFVDAGRGDERMGRQRRLGDAQKQRPAGSGTAAALDGFVVLLAEAEFIHLLFEEEVGIADVFDLDPAHHLACDPLDVLVVDVHALEPVNLLNSVDQISLGELLAKNRKKVMEVDRKSTRLN